MTTSVLAATPTHTRRPVPWRRLSWVAWRRYRTSVAGSVALVAVVSLYLVIRGLQMRSAYAAVQACAPQASARCGFLFDQFHNAYGDVGLAGALLVWAPGVIGAFTGAPLLARELEMGTFRFVWTQGAGRMRWLLALLVPGALGVAGLSALLGVLIRWYEQPLLQSRLQQRFRTNIFPLTGLAIVGWALAAFALGILAGLVIRRVVPALAATLVVWTGLALLTGTLLRAHYETPLTTNRLQLPAHDLWIGQWWTRGGVRVGDAQINQVLEGIGVHANGGGFQAKAGAQFTDPVQYLFQHGYTQWTSYQPDSRYWPFQWIEFGWLAALSVALLGITLWLVRRRAV